jgi:hypothetical protein
LARASAVLLGALAVATALTLGLPSPASAWSCQRWAADTGTDGNPGTQSAPFRTLTRLFASLAPGQTGCLAPGSHYTEHLVISRGGKPGKPIRIFTAGTHRAVLSGRVTVTPHGHDVVLANLIVQGDGSPASATVKIAADRVQLVRTAISGPGYLNSSVPCVRVLNGAQHVVLDRVEIHDCTKISSRKAYGTGLIVADAVGTVVRDSFVYHVPGDAVVLGPAARWSLVTHTIVDGNRSAVLFAGGKHVASHDNRVESSILSYSANWNVHSYWPGPTGKRNTVTDNCLWRGYRGQVNGRGFSTANNLVHSPQYVNRPATHSVRRGACYSKRPLPASMAVTDFGFPWPRLQKFIVHYTLHALKKRVEVDRMALTGLADGTVIDVRCVRGCTGFERVYASHGQAETAMLIGQWLQRGAVVEFRERRSGWIGSYARVRVTGLPRGVRISHACLSPFQQGTPLDCGRYP